MMNLSKVTKSRGFYLAHGTLIVATICDDGILMAADSRGAFTETFIDPVSKSKRIVPFAHYDNELKIFTVGHFKMGMSGISMLAKKYLHTITEEFNKISKKPATIDEAYKEFKDYLNNTLGISDEELFNENQFIFAGYENKKPVILGITKTGTSKLTESEKIMFSDNRFDRYVRVPAHLKMTCSNTAPILARAFDRFARDIGDSCIGGPTYLIEIKPQNKIEIRNTYNPIKYDSYKDFATAVIDKKIPITYLGDGGEERLKNLLLEGIQLGY